MRVLVATWLVASACYRPAEAGECVATCAQDVDCPGELACGGDGLCRNRTAIDCNVRAHDAFPDVVVGDGANVCFGGSGSKLQQAFCRSAFPVGIDVVSFDTDSQCSGSGFELVAQNQGPELCIVYAGSITVSSSAQITGTKPLVLASLGNITVSGGLSVASFRSPATRGAGASFAACAVVDGTPNATGGGGGAPGGSFKGTAGNGGASVGTSTQAAPPPTTSPGFIRGGCAGGHGGAGSSGSLGTGGESGGAVYMIAKRDVVITGVVNANGAGGSANAMSQGGHGGGSGGYIGLEASTVTVGTSALVTALGGGGGAGGNVAAGGTFGGEASGSSPAPGGIGSSAGSGGNGSRTSNPSDAQAGTIAASSGAGGGGGGGGGGYIVVLGDLHNAGALLPPP